MVHNLQRGTDEPYLCNQIKSNEMIEIKNRWTDKVIYTSQKETIREAVIEAIKNDAYLSGANLRGANLRGADLSGANLSDANLSDAYLRGADLSGANLSDANLSDAYLSGANLRGANLRGADLSGANLSDADLSDANLRAAYLRGADLSGAVKIPMYCKWTHGITNENLIHIGCEKRTIEEWDKFFASNDIISTERNTPEFKQIQAVYEAYKAYLTFLQS
jgi:hypothetical protein